MDEEGSVPDWAESPGAWMSAVGAVAAIIGIAVVAYALGMTISVHVAGDYSVATGFTPASDIVNNALVQSQLLTFLGGCFAALSGILLFVGGRIVTALSDSRAKSPPRD
jgi:hypothetical protein